MRATPVAMPTSDTASDAWLNLRATPRSAASASLALTETTWTVCSLTARSHRHTAVHGDHITRTTAQGRCDFICDGADLNYMYFFDT